LSKKYKKPNEKMKLFFFAKKCKILCYCVHRKDEDGISECAPDRGAELSSNVTISASEDRTSEKEHAKKLI
jgi:hypothetical protein